MHQFKFSIITVVKNDQYNIEKTIKSILDQRQYSEVEYIVIDGNSSDKSLSIINRYKNEIDKIISENDTGIYDAMNKGMLHTTGSIIAFCNSGDFLYPKGLFYVEKEFISKKCDFVFGTVKRNYLGSQIVKKGFNKKRIHYNFDFATAHSTGFYAKKELINFIGNYNTKFKCSSDYDFYMRMINANKFLGSSTTGNKIIGEVASGGYSSTLSFFDHLLEETKIRIKNKQNIFYIALIFINAIFKNYLNKIKIIYILISLIFIFLLFFT